MQLCIYNLSSLQAHCGQPIAQKGPKLDYGRISLPRIAYNIYQNEIMSLGKQWVPGCRGSAETFRDRCLASKKKHINRGNFISEDDKLEDIAMALYTERTDFVAKNKVLYISFPVRSYLRDLLLHLTADPV